METDTEDKTPATSGVTPRKDAAAIISATVGFFTRKLSENLLASIIAGIAAGIIAGGATVWGLVSQLPGWVGITPASAVMAFDLEGGCPSGWTSYDKGNGRLIIGAATTQSQQRTPGDFVRDSRGADLIAREFGKPGGVQRVLLAKENIPPIYLNVRHKLSGSDVTVSLVASIGFDKPAPRPEFTILQSSDQPAAPFETMPPYVALHFCKKT